ncbi:Pum2 [Nucleospora cyclopteri]
MNPFVCLFIVSFHPHFFSLFVYPMNLKRCQSVPPVNENLQKRKEEFLKSNFGRALNGGGSQQKEAILFRNSFDDEIEFVDIAKKREEMIGEKLSSLRLMNKEEYQRMTHLIDAPPFHYADLTANSNALIWLKEVFSRNKSTVEMIDDDYPERKAITVSEEEKKIKRSTTPVGSHFCDYEFVQGSYQPVVIPGIKEKKNVKAKNSSTIVEEVLQFHQQISSEKKEVVVTNKTACAAVCKDQEGSRFIQNKLDQWSREEVTTFFAEIVENSLELSTNLFGNYVIQKIIAFLGPNECYTLIAQFFTHIYSLSTHVYGCRVVQKLIDHVEDISFIVDELAENISDLIASPNGNHVIQKCIEKNIDKLFIIREFEKDCIHLAQQRYGCRVLQRLFEVCSEEQVRILYMEILSNIDQLINDKYGNYVIQHLIQTDHSRKEEIFDYIIRNSVELSKYKFSSNVIEKCVINSSKSQLSLFLDVFSRPSSLSDPRPSLYYMCTDMYANYVVQKFFDTADEELKEKTKRIIQRYLKDMKMIPFTKHILSKLSL